MQETKLGNKAEFEKKVKEWSKSNPKDLTFGQRLALARYGYATGNTGKEISRETLGKSLGLAPSVFSKYETDTAEPRYDTIKRLHSFNFGTEESPENLSYEYLFGEDEYVNKNDQLLYGDSLLSPAAIKSLNILVESDVVKQNILDYFIKNNIIRIINQLHKSISEILIYNLVSLAYQDSGNTSEQQEFDFFDEINQSTIKRNFMTLMEEIYDDIVDEFTSDSNSIYEEDLQLITKDCIEQFSGLGKYLIELSDLLNTEIVEKVQTQKVSLDVLKSMILPDEENE